jgi:integrase
MSNRGHGEGTIFQRKDGRWQGALQIDGTRRTVYGSTRKEVQTKLRELQKQTEAIGTLPPSGRYTVNDLLDTWLGSATNLKPSTVHEYRWFLKTYVRPIIGGMQIERVTPNHFQQLYTNLTPSMGAKIHRLLHRAFAVAVLWQWIAANPCDRVLKPNYKTSQKVLWTEDELNTFLEQTTHHWQYPLWALLMATGCRLGEGLALRWEDVDDKGVLTISRTLHRLEDKWVMDSPKTASSARVNDHLVMYQG